MIVKGNQYTFYTKEARLAHYETVIKSFFKAIIAQFITSKQKEWFPQIPIVMWQRGAIAFGAVAEVAYAVNATQTTASITVSGSDTLGFGCLHDQATGSTITTATWNGSNMTSIKTIAQGGGQGSDYLYGIVSPTTGTVSATRGTNSNSFEVSGLYYTGCNQSTTLDATNSSNGTGGATVTTTITPVGSNCWAFSMFHNDSGSVSLSSGGTLRGAIQSTVSGQADSNTTVTAGNPYSIVWNSFNNPGVNWSWITASIAPPITTSVKTVNGLAKSSVKTVNGLAIASVKSINGLQ
ncbi:MAG TPA: hypothetical protein PKV66_04605 [Candidatus Pelethenecus sp.]|nr:hypothetical protein [Candidatus Pelethenecus sp.]